MSNHYDIPPWAGKPPVGLHLDVLKGERLVQKLMIDQKKCYLFGRNQEMCDFSVDHQSCSRVHAAFIYHKSLNKPFLVDLNSTHGTFIGNVRIESHKPTQLPVDSQFHFGHSTRMYTLRARPVTPNHQIMEELDEENESNDSDSNPENELAMDNITEYNTAHNRRIPLIGITDKSETFSAVSDTKEDKRVVTFNDEDEIINPEDVDPSIGRFRNLIHSTVIPAKRFKDYENFYNSNTYNDRNHRNNSLKYMNPQTNFNDLYYDIPALHYQYDNEGHENNDDGAQKSIVEQLGLPLPNPAPDVETFTRKDFNTGSTLLPLRAKLEPETPKKKYAKEAWPGKKPTASSSVAVS